MHESAHLHSTASLTTGSVGSASPWLTRPTSSLPASLHLSSQDSTQGHLHPHTRRRRTARRAGAHQPSIRPAAPQPPGPLMISRIIFFTGRPISLPFRAGSVTAIGTNLRLSPSVRLVSLASRNPYPDHHLPLLAQPASYSLINGLQPPHSAFSTLAYIHTAHVYYVFFTLHRVCTARVQQQATNQCEY